MECNGKFRLLLRLQVHPCRGWTHGFLPV